MRTTKLLVAALAVVLLAAACGGDDDDSASAVGSAAGKEKDGEATTTTTAPDEPTTTALATTTTAAPTGLALGPDYVTTEGPSGSGCTPGERDTLPAGWWAGEITSVHDSAVDLDLVCFFSGDAATTAASEDGNEATNDYYVRNNNQRTFRVTFPPGVAATCAGTDAEPFACQAADVLTLYRTTDSSSTSVLDGTDLVPFPLIWVHVTGDSGDYLYMQYTP